LFSALTVTLVETFSQVTKHLFLNTFARNGVLLEFYMQNRTSTYYMDCAYSQQDSLLRKATEGEMEGKITRVRPRTPLLDHLMIKNGNQRYGQVQLKEMA